MAQHTEKPTGESSGQPNDYFYLITLNHDCFPLSGLCLTKSAETYTVVAGIQLLSTCTFWRNLNILTVLNFRHKMGRQLCASRSAVQHNRATGISSAVRRSRAAWHFSCNIKPKLEPWCRLHLPGFVSIAAYR